jgi:hypothetical protein
MGKLADGGLQLASEVAFVTDYELRLLGVGYHICPLVRRTFSLDLGRSARSCARDLVDSGSYRAGKPGWVPEPL